MFKKRLNPLAVLIAVMLTTSTVHAMHIMEGFLPPQACIGWGIFCLPFLFLGVRTINRRLAENPQAITILAMAGAFTFVLSALKIPSVTGCSSHITGLGFAAMMFGPTVSCVLALIVLLFQALLLAHGGLTTLGANMFSMGIVGPIIAFLIYTSLCKTKVPRSITVFFAAALGDLASYLSTSLQLALVYPSEVGGISASFAKFVGIFAVTQIPLAVIEGILTVVLVNFIVEYGGGMVTSFGKEKTQP